VCPEILVRAALSKSIKVVENQRLFWSGSEATLPAICQILPVPGKQGHSGPSQT
jgi:hypothetical protein